MSMLVITTGGTIGACPYEDPQNPPQVSTMPHDGRDLVSEFLSEKFSGSEYRCVSLEPRDSKFIDEPYRQNILGLIEKAPEKQIVLTHGTDTILQSADFFYRQAAKILEPQGKRLILTGAMTPLSNGPQSDGYLNLELSLNLLRPSSSSLSSVNIVLCDFDQKGEWKPRIYNYSPGKYEKFYSSDGQYSRVQEIVSQGISVDQSFSRPKLSKSHRPV